MNLKSKLRSRLKFISGIRLKVRIIIFPGAVSVGVGETCCRDWSRVERRRIDDDRNSSYSSSWTTIPSTFVRHSRNSASWLPEKGIAQAREAHRHCSQEIIGNYPPSLDRTFLLSSSSISTSSSSSSRGSTSAAPRSRRNAARGVLIVLASLVLRWRITTRPMRKCASLLCGTVILYCWSMPGSIDGRWRWMVDQSLAKWTCHNLSHNNLKMNLFP